MNNCSKDGCIQRTSTKYCSLACANSANPKRKRKCSDGIQICGDKKCECQVRLPALTCAVCGNPRSSRSKKYCSSARCKAIGTQSPERELEIAKFLANELNAQGSNGRDRSGLIGWAREVLLKEANHACIECGWNTPHPRTGKPPLEIDHIDGNRNNNYRRNLRVLCPNCHSLTLTYRRGNLGNNHILV